MYTFMDVGFFTHPSLCIYVCMWMLDFTYINRCIYWPSHERLDMLLRMSTPQQEHVTDWIDHASEFVADIEL